ncbi:hypothetical protein BDP27DRAFT_783612 [Rhodocollybia butyracea]|uniref:Uncharacterized protein n=1 Tax=Rhodocollybia butyracea TaxID=206335 RepID=A0A9P5PV57_9AGAR|nr:hypothetical protein BDP27DRAFT_783612 [Rhodocollybia butyracea]
MSSVTSIQSSFIGAFLSTLFYGFYLSIAFRCSVVLYHRYKTERARAAYLLVTHVTLFLLINIRCIIVVVRALKALFDQGPDGTISESSLWSTGSLLVNIPLYLTILTSDIFICYRTYIVWSRSLKIIIIPILLLLGDFGLLIYTIKTLATESTPDYFDTLNHAGEYFMIVTLISNVVNTALISYRIWSVRRSVCARPGNPKLDRFLSTLVESAAAYSLLLIILTVLYSTNSFLVYIFIDMQAPVIGIVFLSIIISVTRGAAFGDTTASSTSIVSSLRSSSKNWTTPARPSRVEIRMSRVVQTQREPCLYDPRNSIIEADIYKASEV